MDITALVNSIAPYLIMAAPFLKQLGGTIGEEAAKEVATQAAKKLGDGSWGVAKSIWQKLRGSKPETQTAIDSALNDVADDPDDADTQAVLRVKLKKALKEDATLLEGIVQIFREANATNVEGDKNVVFGANASNNIVAKGDGIAIGDGNVNLVNKRP